VRETRKSNDVSLDTFTALLDRVFARVPEAVVLLDIDDRILQVNPEFTRVFGYGQEEACGRLINELIVPEELLTEAEELTRRGLRGESMDLETVRKHKDGSRVHVSIVSGPVSVAGSQIAEYVIYRDITERKRSEQRLRESEAYLAEAQRLSGTGSWAWNPATGDIRYCSEMCCRVLGFDHAGPPPPIEEFFQRLHPDDQAASRERFEKAIRDKADFEWDYRIVHPEKGIRDIHTVGRAVLDGSGNLAEFVGTVIDVTERKHAEQELRKSEADLRAITDSIRQFIVVLAPDGTTLYANKVALENTGLTTRDLTNENLLTRDGLPRQAAAPGELAWNQAWTKTAHPDDLNRIRAERRKGLLQGAPFELEVRLLLKNGQYRWQLFQYNPLKDEYGQMIRWYVTATDIDDRKRAENVRLEERTRIAQELHDTLLQTVQGASMHLGAALFGMTEDSAVKKRLERIVQLMSQGIDEGRNAIQGLRSSDSIGSEDLIVALSAIRHELQISPDIDFRIMVTGRQNQLPTQIRNEIYRIGREALVNAFSHSGAKRVELELEYSDNELCMRIRDNGCGMDPRVVEQGRDGHWGLAGMRERATRVGGLVKVFSSPTGGTEVQLFIPISIALEHSSSHHKSA